jgi:hypothetical protein
VIVMLACPKISDTTCNGVPWASISEAPVRLANTWAIIAA